MPRGRRLSPDVCFDKRENNHIEFTQATYFLPDEGGGVALSLSFFTLGRYRRPWYAGFTSRNTCSVVRCYDAKRKRHFTTETTTSMPGSSVNYRVERLTNRVGEAVIDATSQTTYRGWIFDSFLQRYS